MCGAWNDVGSQFIAPWRHGPAPQAGAMNCDPTMECIAPLQWEALFPELT